MQFMMMVKMRESQRDAPPELYAAMDTYISEAVKGGKVVGMGGLKPSAHGAEVRGSDGRIVVSHGPFAETTELIGGWAIVECDSLDEAIEEARTFIQLHIDNWPGFEGASEVRQVEEMPA